MITNEIIQKDDYAIVRAANEDYVFKISNGDVSAVKPFRWRVYYPDVITEDNGRILKLAHYLLGKHPDEEIIFKNEDCLDFRRENIAPKLWGGQKPHTITVGPKYSWLHLGLCDVKIDTKEVPRIDKLTWTAGYVTYGGDRKILIRANYKTKKIHLHRYIMKAKENELVGYKNGDILDCTKENLYFIDRAELKRNGSGRDSKSQKRNKKNKQSRRRHSLR